MFRIIKKLNVFLSVKQRSAFYGLIFLMVFSAFLEIIGIGMIPIFISAVLDFELLNNYLVKLNISSLNFITQINQDDLLLYMSIFVLSLFLFKNLFLMLVHYLQSYFSYKVIIISIHDNDDARCGALARLDIFTISNLKLEATFFNFIICIFLKIVNSNLKKIDYTNN